MVRNCVSLVGKDLTCPLLTQDGKCSVYRVRPTICRLWGMTKDMKCPHGCKPSRWMNKAETYAFLDAAEQIV
jgi:Fe-S-cluster containining protein